MVSRLSAIAFGVVAVLALASCETDNKPPPSSSTSSTVQASPTDTPLAGPTTPAIAPNATTPTGAAVMTPVVGSVLAPPVPVPGTDGKIHLAYELELTNTLSQEVTLTSVAAVAGDKTLQTLTGDGLAYWTRVLGSKTPTNKIGPGQTALVWLDVAVDDQASVPADVGHMVGLAIPQPQPPLIPATTTESIAPTRVETRQPAAIASPLRGPGWLNGDGCCGMSAHRMAMNPLNGQLWGAERFAIDFVQLTPEGRLYTGDAAKLESYAYFGTDIHAVADGPVVAVVNDLPEQVPGKNPTGLPLDQYAGNHIVQDIGGGNYAFYAHLQPGSVKVKPGDQLSTGQSIAALGNSGNTDAPHLHFHVMSTPDPLRSNGLPFVFTAFRLDSRAASAEALDALLTTGGPLAMQPGFAASDQKNRMPLNLDTVSFPAG